MTMESINMIRVTCDHCRKESGTFENRKAAIEAGWTWPNDSAFVWCPDCGDAHSALLSAGIKWRSRSPDPSSVKQVGF